MASREEIDQQELDIGTAVARIEQIAQLNKNNENGLLDFIIHRLVTCDGPRLRRMVTDPKLLYMIDELGSEA